MSLKSEVIKSLKDLPDSATIDEINYRLYVIGKVMKGEESLKKGGIPHAQVAKRFSKWLIK